MARPESVTQWLQALKATGDPEAAQKLWERYFHNLLGLARARLGCLPRRAADEEDVVVSAFESFFRAAAAGRFPLLEDRDDLWRLLVRITERKAYDLIAYASAKKRDGRRVADGIGPDHCGPLSHLAARDPDPAFAAEIADELRHLLSLLKKDNQRRVALLKLEGYTNKEIAEQLGVVEKSVELKLRIIRETWKKRLRE
jgi:RNA polymerase sigma factor (sigma-70 family)